MSYAWREQIENENGIFNVAWIVNAAWAHPLWHQYLVVLYDLTTEGVPAIMYMPDATHEFVVYALDPECHIKKDAPINDCRKLEGPNYAYQFRAESNEAAMERIQEIVDRIVKLKLSPDTDYRWYWDGMLRDMYPLVR